MLISVQEADEAIRAAISPGPIERVSIGEAGGRVLRQTVRTPRPLPPFDRVMMDGIAVSADAFASGRRRFTIEGTAHAGEPAVSLGSENCAWRVMTGAVCPRGASLVIPREMVELVGEVAAVAAEVTLPPSRFIHRMGSDAAEGATLLESGTRLGGAALGVVASCNCASVDVARRPRVALISSGDELVEPGQPLAPHQIPRSNLYALSAMVSRHGVAEVERHHFFDHPSALKAGLSELLEGFDFLVCSGGVSSGDRDFLPSVLMELGVAKRFHGVAQRPGKPFWFGVHEGGSIVFALPGNPVSTLVGGRRFVVPAIRQWMGQTMAPRQKLPLSASYRFPPPLAAFLPVRHRGTSVEPAPVGNSGDFANLVRSDGFVELPAAASDFPTGYAASYFPW